MERRRSYVFRALPDGAGLSGTEWQREIRAVDADMPVVLVTGHGHIPMAVQAMREGAYDFIEKPFTTERLVAVMRVHGLTHILTLNTQDFRRYPGIVAVHPQEVAAAP